jgi:hypothetical protein
MNAARNMFSFLTEHIGRHIQQSIGEVTQVTQEVTQIARAQEKLHYIVECARLSAHAYSYPAPLPILEGIDAFEQCEPIEEVHTVSKRCLFAVLRNGRSEVLLMAFRGTNMPALTEFGCVAKADTTPEQVIAAARSAIGFALDLYDDTRTAGRTLDFGIDLPGELHDGFNEAYTSIRLLVREKLYEVLARHPNIQEIFVTGHSLGGAMANLAALDIKACYPVSQRVNLVTFGAPAVGNNVFAETCSTYIGLANTYRIVNRGDGIVLAMENGFHKIFHELMGYGNIDFVHFGTQIHVEKDNEPLIQGDSDPLAMASAMLTRMLQQHSMEKYIANLLGVVKVSSTPRSLHSTLTELFSCRATKPCLSDTCETKPFNSLVCCSAVCCPMEAKRCCVQVA